MSTSEYSLDDIWNDFEKYKLNDTENKLNDTENNLEKENTCNHIIDIDGVCELCGVELVGHNIYTGSEWNNYKDDSGKFNSSSQRADVYNDQNPYSTGGTLAFNTNTLIGKLQLQMTFSHKQKTYWLIGKEIEHYSSILGIQKTVIEQAKKYWHEYMESGKLTRASVRKGLIAACLYHSCLNHNFPITREQILETFNCCTKTLSKGEKVLFEIIKSDKLVYKNDYNSEENAFIKYCTILGLPYTLNNNCNILYNKHKIHLQAVTPKSAIGGIIAYLVKNKLKLKKPTKTIISTTVDVCTPTINKVILLLEKLENK